MFISGNYTTWPIPLQLHKEHFLEEEGAGNRLKNFKIFLCVWTNCQMNGRINSHAVRRTESELMIFSSFLS